MSISATALRALLAAGATAEMIVAVVEAELAASEDLKVERRERDRLRKQAERAAEKLSAPSAPSTPSEGRSGHGGQPQGEPQTVGSPLPPPPTSRSGVAAPVAAENPPVGPLKRKVSPHPSKEKLSTFEKLPLEIEFDEENKIEVGTARARGRPACRLPDDWSPSLDDMAFALTLLTADRAHGEIEKFRDYWHARAGPHAVKRSWSATWRMWCRKSAEFDGGGNGNNRPSNRGGSGQGGRGRGFAAYAIDQARTAGET